jgi:hypothetical protein
MWQAQGGVSTGIWVGNLKGRDLLEGIDIDEGMILKWFLKK